MWRPWSRSSSSNHSKNNNNTSRRNFAFSTFKDIETICSQDSIPSPNKSPISTRLPSICHRGNPILRAQSTPESILHFISDSPTKRKLEPPLSLPGSQSRIVVYYTSIRAVRATFEACKAILAILQSFRVPIDERDLSMDSSFLTELKQILKDESVTLPRVFINGRHVGGAEEVKQLHECGELKKLVSGLPRVEGGGACHSCGGFRFVLCGECSGGRKIYREKGGGFRSCTSCNENGLVRCLVCSFQSPVATTTY